MSLETCIYVSLGILLVNARLKDWLRTGRIDALTRRRIVVNEEQKLAKLLRSLSQPDRSAEEKKDQPS